MTYVGIKTGPVYLQKIFMRSAAQHGDRVAVRRYCTDRMWLAPAREPPTRVRMLCEIALLNALPVRGIVDDRKQSDVASQRYAGPTRGRTIAPDGDRGDMGGR